MSANLAIYLGLAFLAISTAVIAWLLLEISNTLQKIQSELKDVRRLKQQETTDRLTP
ncbi:MAG: hypothetical protein AAFR51_07935 [Pseudomonadota bacterium]